MDAEDFVPCLQKAASSPQIKKLLKQLGLKAPSLKRGDNDAWVVDHKRGLALVFEPAEDKRGVLELVDVQLYRGGSEKFKPYTGRLPRDITFSDSRVAARKRLGKPDAAGTELAIDSWDYDDFTLVLEYAKGNKAIGLVHVQKPFSDDD